MTYGDAFNYDLEIKDWRKAGSFNVLSQHSAINKFYRDNKERLNTYKAMLERLHKEYLMVDEKGGFVTEEINGKQVVKLVDGKKEEDFKKAYDRLRDTPINKPLVYYVAEAAAEPVMAVVPDNG